MSKLVENKYRPFQIIHSFEGLINGTDAIEVMSWGRTRPLDLTNFEERVRIELEKLVERGIGGIVVNFGIDGYLESEEGWKRFILGLKIAVELNLKIWIYDENGYPSGFAGGLVLRNHPELEARGIKRLKIENPRTPVSIAPPEPEALIYAVFGISEDGRRTKLPGQKLSPEFPLASGSYKHLEIYFISPLRAGTRVAYPDNPCPGYINILDKRAINRFISVTHLNYFKKIPEHLWKHIEAIFTDEPSLVAHYIVDTDEPLYPVMPWCEEVEDVFFKNNGYLIEERIYSLFEGQSPEDKRTRRHFWETITELYERSFSQISDVCSSINIDLTGHLFCEDRIYMNAITEGNPISLLRHFQRPGVDMLTSNPKMLANFIFGLKMVLSAALFGGRKRLMTEVSEYAEYWVKPDRIKKLKETREYWTGDRNACSIEEIKHTIAYLFLSGIRDYSFYYTWRHFTVKEYREITDFTTRLCTYGKDSLYQPNYALYYPIEKVWEEYLPSEEHFFRDSLKAQSEKLKKIEAVMSASPSKKTDISKELFFANIQYILCDRSNLHKLIDMEIKALLFPPIGDPDQGLVDFCEASGIEFIRLDETRAEALKEREGILNLQTGENVVYACYDRFIFVLNTGRTPSFIEVNGNFESLFPSRADKKIKVSNKIELNPLESLFIFQKG